MRARVLAPSLLPALLLACAHSRALPPELRGAWQSNRALTLAEIDAVPDLSPEQRRALADPKVFGGLVHVFDARVGIALLEGRCGPSTPHRVVAAGAGSVQLASFDALFEKEAVHDLRFEDGHLALPILGGRAREIFTRVDRAALEREYPCLASFPPLE